MAPHDLYQTFVAIYRAGSISGAARLRHLTQPAVSQQLAALEALVGAPLFQRTSRGVVPTSRGEDLYAQLFDALDRLERVTRGLRQPAADEGRGLRLGAEPEYFHTVALGRLAGLRLRLQVSFAEPREQLAQLEAGALDAVVSTLRPPQRTLQHRVLGQRAYAMVGPPSLEPPPPDTPPEGLAAWLNRQPWVSYSVDLPITRRFWHQRLGARFAAQQTVVVPDLRAVLRAVELGYGLSILPEYVCRAALDSGSVREVWPVRDLIPADQWALSFREVDSDRPALRELAARLVDRS